MVRVWWPQQSPAGGWCPDAGVAFKFSRSWHCAGGTQPGCKAPAVSCEPCWVGCSGFSLRKQSCCMTLSWVVAGAHVLQSEKGQFLQCFCYFN